MWFRATIIVNKTLLLKGLRNGCCWQGIWYLEKYTKKMDSVLLWVQCMRH